MKGRVVYWKPENDKWRHFTLHTHDWFRASLKVSYSSSNLKLHKNSSDFVHNLTFACCKWYLTDNDIFWKETYCYSFIPVDGHSELSKYISTIKYWYMPCCILEQACKCRTNSILKKSIEFHNIIVCHMFILVCSSFFILQTQFGIRNLMITTSQHSSPDVVVLQIHVLILNLSHIGMTMYDVPIPLWW